VVQVRYDPFDLSEVFIYDIPTKTLLETSTPTKQVNSRAPNIPEESRRTKGEISQQSVAYFTRLREKYLQSQKAASEVSFQTLRQQHAEDSHA
jgi:hypothetical protein